MLEALTDLRIHQAGSKIVEAPNRATWQILGPQKVNALGDHVIEWTS